MIYKIDKAGDCYIYSFLTAAEEKGKLILGHLSYILDVVFHLVQVVLVLQETNPHSNWIHFKVVTPDDKFIITSERDEKIRVSNYPNAYNIHNFCLGHTEFVTSLSLVSSNLLLSGSGVGTYFQNFLVLNLIRYLYPTGRNNKAMGLYQRATTALGKDPYFQRWRHG